MVTHCRAMPPVNHPRPWADPLLTTIHTTYDRSKDKHLFKFLGQPSPPGPVLKPLCKPATQMEPLWTDTPLYSKDEYNHSKYIVEKSPSPTYYRRRTHKPRQGPHCKRPTRFGFGSTQHYQKARTRYPNSSPVEGIIRRSPLDNPYDASIGDGRCFTAMQPPELARLGMNTAHMHSEPQLAVYDKQVMPRVSHQGFEVKMGGQGPSVMCTSPVAQAHVFVPNPVGEVQQVLRPSVLAACTWPVGRRELLRNVSSHLRADPLEVFPHEYAQCGNAGQQCGTTKWEKGPALDPILTNVGTGTAFMSEHAPPLWQEQNGVRFHRFRCSNTPYNSVRPRPTAETLSMMMEQDKKKKQQKVSLTDQLKWIEKGEATYKLSCLDTSTIPREIRE